jgi:hypothetical protein
MIVTLLFIKALEGEGKNEKHTIYHNVQTKMTFFYDHMYEISKETFCVCCAIYYPLEYKYSNFNPK